MKQLGLAALAISLLSLANISAQATILTLDFDGLQNNERVLGFYNGGAGSLGSTKGYDYGISFTTNVLAYKASSTDIVSPTPTYMFLEKIQDSEKDPKGPYYMNVEAGFTSLAFDYSALLMPEGAKIRIYSGFNGTGEEFDPIELPATADYNTWSSVFQSIPGVAKSVVFTEVQGYPCIANLTLDLDPPPVTAVPEASTWLAGIGCLFPLLNGLVRKLRK